MVEFVVVLLKETNLVMKKKAQGRLGEPKTKIHRYRPADELLQFLQRLKLCKVRAGASAGLRPPLRSVSGQFARCKVSSIMVSLPPSGLAATEVNLID